MLTVKHIRLSGEEDIYLTNRINYTPKRAAQSGSDQQASLWIDQPDGRIRQLMGGTIFVMNDSGATVSRYDLGASMVPLDAQQAEAPLAA